MDSQRSQILHWIRTGNQVIRAEYTKPHSVKILESNLNLEDGPSTGSCSDNNSGTSDPSISTVSKLVGVENDALVPKQDDITRIYHKGRETWMHFVKSAEALPPNTLPAGLGDPSIALKDIPALPERLPDNGPLVGRPVWHVSDPGYEQKQDGQGDEAWNPMYVSGIHKYFHLSTQKPIECRISSAPDFVHFGYCTRSNGRLSSGPEGLSLLTLCWSYIFSIKLLELQGKRALYTPHFVRPRIPGSFKTNQDDVVLHLTKGVSSRLIRWLCAILAPKPGWSGPNSRFPPWAAFCSGTARFILSLDEPLTPAFNEPPPNSTEATEFLIQICSIYGLGCEEQQGYAEGKNGEPMSSPTAAFYAALALPFYWHLELQPQFSLPMLKGKPTDVSAFTYIRQYVRDLRYYMSLSLDPRSLGSVVWSIFWQPEIECNVVSPWLASIASVIKPIIHSRDLQLMAKTFAFRRPRVALWWLGLFLLGNPATLDFIARYLETLEERWGYGSMAPPDITAAAWIGSPQSFLDLPSSQQYPDTKCQVSKVDVLRHRYNFQLQDTSSLPLSWRPFGHFPKDTIELELWPHLEVGSSRKYVHWV